MINLDSLKYRIDFEDRTIRYIGFEILEIYTLKVYIYAKPNSEDISNLFSLQSKENPIKISDYNRFCIYILENDFPIRSDNPLYIKFANKKRSSK